MAHTTEPPLCPNPDCRSPLAGYDDVTEYGRVSGLKIAACARCGVALAVWPNELDNLRRDLDDIKRKMR